MDTVNGGQMTYSSNDSYIGFDHIRNDAGGEIDRDDGEPFVADEGPGAVEFPRDERAGDEGWRPF
jgi:hypothetical protein